MSDDVRVIADKAYDALIEGFQTGSWEGFFDLFDDEVDVILPAPQTGHFTGTEGREKLVGFFGVFAPGASRFDQVEVISKTVAEDRVVVEDWARGVFFGEPYAARHCIHLMVRNGKVVGFHEYNRPLD
ncbi:nuclear transport factor 2 family protein [Micromonospora sp. WMMD967]|uniref:nuclear transport factor 2 family protein n=1 Tax=Micromonospora sp. WMMD967 TaxID=3016101 RepID=UPI002416CBBC|nr:nuclear transport factor 2 family protein [Micromonospora sp. WMMD967]MDG4840160.1 nuclear transport factor 2 family protein [Micromonospora sp. WMMD967]